ncbi:MAG: four helix bundle protein [Aestuariibacter sp.]|nr:four helix bundle protein [Aestuariibacter sp.]
MMGATTTTPAATAGMFGWCAPDSDFIFFMKHLQKLPLWRDANKLLIQIETAVRDFPRYHKYTIGTEMRHQAMAICRLIVRALDDRPPKLQQVVRLNLAVEDLKVQIQLAKEIKAFNSFNDFSTIVELVVNIGKQSGGWRRKLQQHDYTPSRSLYFITLKPLIQVGNQVEIFSKDLSALSSKISKFFKADVMPRSGFSSRIAAPLKTSGALKRELKKEHKAFIYITEAGYLKGGMKRRLLHGLYHPELMHETI